MNLDPLITIIYAHPQKRALLLFDAAGSQYSDLAELTTRYFTQQFIELINVMQQQHVISFEFQFNYQELHFRVFAFFATVCDILKHNYQEAETKALCRGLYQFFYPGWLTWLQIKQPG
ncbi:hypothetical protein [Fructilactobacillus florum]|uniref:Uncharacterized protein n=1 Tax=Fructilactobacillus florum DSM 22689 = JCM 16035 TaxID=1423745 RepID=A0A0R2CGW1_9LACO|nr:hypothetical protein [Fructilactobacillus florum]KRM90538.1 hypothetical protein FC87_GL001224 [Fructilactobacillus florum DSM 22689 = JCM 16035]